MAGAWLPPQWQEPLFYGLGQSILVALIAFGLLWQLPTARDARTFLLRLCAAFLLWLSIEILTYVPDHWIAPGIRQVFEELGFFCVYLIFVWAIESTERQFRTLSWLDSLAAPLFVIGLSGYLLVIPLLQAPAEYDSFLPSHLFYIFMDLYLLVRILSLLMICADRGWQQLLWSWFWAFLGLTLTDVLDATWWFGLFESHYDDFWQGVYLLPMASALAFSGWFPALQRLRPLPDLPRWARHLLRRESRIIGFTLLLLVIHLIGYRAGVFEELLRSPREWFLMGWLVGGFVMLQLHRQQLQPLPELVPTADEEAAQEVESVIEQAPSAEIASTVTIDKDEAEHSQQDNDAQFIQRIEATLEAHYSEAGFDVEALATALAISVRQLQRRLKAIADCTPADYLRRFRLLKAADLLRQGHKVAFVAAQTGFQQQSHFGRCFKEMYGCTPGQFAQKGRISGE